MLCKALGGLLLCIGLLRFQMHLFMTSMELFWSKGEFVYIEGAIITMFSSISVTVSKHSVAQLLMDITEALSVKTYGGAARTEGIFHV